MVPIYSQSASAHAQSRKDAVVKLMPSLVLFINPIIAYNVADPPQTLLINIEICPVEFESGMLYTKM